MYKIDIQVAEKLFFILLPQAQAHIVPAEIWLQVCRSRLLIALDPRAFCSPLWPWFSCSLEGSLSCAAGEDQLQITHSAE